MFSFVIKYFGFLKHLPLLPHVFENFMKVMLLFTNARVLDCIDDIEAEVLSWPCTSISMHKYGGLQFNYGGKELGHIHGNGLLDMLFSRKIKQELLAEGRISHHHFFTNSGWISFYIRNEDDREYAKGLLKMAYARTFPIAMGLKPIAMGNTKHVLPLIIKNHENIGESHSAL